MGSMAGCGRATNTPLVLLPRPLLLKIAEQHDGYNWHSLRLTCKALNTVLLPARIRISQSGVASGAHDLAIVSSRLAAAWPTLTHLDVDVDEWECASRRLQLASLRDFDSFFQNVVTALAGERGLGQLTSAAFPFNAVLLSALLRHGKLESVELWVDDTVVNKLGSEWPVSTLHRKAVAEVGQCLQRMHACRSLRRVKLRLESLGLSQPRLAQKLALLGELPNLVDLSLEMDMEEDESIHHVNGAIGKLQGLTNLDLQLCDILTTQCDILTTHDCIPLGPLPCLRSFTITIGDQIDDLPVGLSSCLQLEKVIVNCQLMNPFLVGQELGALPNLTHLDLDAFIDGNLIGELSSYPKLTYLRCKVCVLDEVYGEFPALEELHARGIEFASDCKVMWHSLMPKLKFLESDYYQCPPSSLAHMHHLRSLCVPLVWLITATDTDSDTGNRLGDSDTGTGTALDFHEALATLTSLRCLYVDMTHSRVQGPGASIIEIPHQIGSCLVELRLLLHKDVQHLLFMLLESMPNLPNLRALHMEARIWDREFEEVAASLVRWSRSAWPGRLPCLRTVAVDWEMLLPGFYDVTCDACHVTDFLLGLADTGAHINVVWLGDQSDSHWRLRYRNPGRSFALMPHGSDAWRLFRQAQGQVERAQQIQALPFHVQVS